MSEPFQCTRATPWTSDIPGRVEHEEASETDDERDFGGGCCCVKMHCPVCGHRWWRELPQ